MVEDRLTDGTRIAQLLASEIDGHDDVALAVSDANPDVEPTEDGALAYRVVSVSDAGGDATTDADAVAEVFVHPDRARVEFVTAVDAAAEAADAEGLRVRPKAVRPPRTLVFVEDGAQAKWVLPAFRAVAADADSV